MKLERALDSVRLTLAARLKPTGLTARQVGVLDALRHIGPLQQNQLAVKLLVGRASVTLIVDELERSGLVRREQEIEDRRCIVVHLTAAGRECIDRIFPEQVAAVVEAFAGLTAREQKLLGWLCRKLGLSLFPYRQ